MGRITAALPYIVSEEEEEDDDEEELVVLERTSCVLSFVSRKKGML